MGQDHIGTRIGGFFNLLGAIGEMAGGTVLLGISGVMEVGSAALATPAAAVTAVAGGVLVFNGIDVGAAGLTEMWYGTPQKTLTEQALAASAVGFDENSGTIFRRASR